jgi:hypothetical protein
MTEEQTEKVKRHFLEWSGGFEPETEYQIIVYVDYARLSDVDRDETLECLEGWMLADSDVSRFMHDDHH